MFGLSGFSDAPFSAYLKFSPATTVSGLQANALLNSVNARGVTTAPISGVVATMLLNSGINKITFPVTWTLIDTSQYPSV